MSTRKELISNFYNQVDEDSRLIKRRCSQLEHLVTNKYIHKYLKPGDKIIEIGAGTGKYSIALAEEGYDVTAVELVESNLETLRRNAMGIETIRSYQEDATNLSRFKDNSFDVTLSFGPMYHLYDKDEINKAIDEAIRITKPGGVILIAFLSVYGIMYSNYYDGTWEGGFKENYDENNNIRHFKEQLFTGYDIKEFEDLFLDKSIKYINTVGVDGFFESIETNPNFRMSDEDFKKVSDWYLTICEKRELLGATNHLLYICKKL